MTAVPARRLPRRFYARDSLEVAPELLNKVMVAGSRAGRIVEVEAYRGGDDPASHAFRGPSRRNATMFGPPGHLYVYFTYGMHWCANAVCMPAGTAQAVLIRALEPLAGIEEMRVARPGARRDLELCAGPARLCQALGVDGRCDGVDLVARDTPVWIGSDGVPPPDAPAVGPRIGIRQGTEHEFRFWVPESKAVARFRPVGPPRSQRLRSSPRR